MNFKELQIGNQFLNANEYKKMRNFFAKALKEKHSYKVAMAPRCFQLCFFFAQEEKLEDLKKCIISQNALLLYAEEIASYYHQNGKFPRILMIDDFLFYGNVIYHTLYTLEKLVSYYMKKNYPDNKMDELLMFSNLIDAVDIMIYATFECAPVVSPLFAIKAKITEELYDDELLSLLFNTSKFLLEMDSKFRITSNSFMPSILKEALEDISDVPKTWEQIKWNYSMISDGISKNYYIRQLESQIFSILQSVQEEARWITGISLIERFKVDDLDKYCSIIANYLSSLNDEKYIHLIYLMKIESLYLIEQKAQLLTFFFSLVSLFDFANMVNPELVTDDNWKKLIYEQSDIGKIASNFSKPSDILEAMYDICSNIAFIMLLKEKLLQGDIKECTHIKISDSTKYNIEICAEDIFGKLGMNLEINAYEYNHNIRAYNPLEPTSNFITLKEYKTQMMQKVGCATSDEALIACMLSLAHAGVVYITIHLDQEEKNDLMTTIQAK